MKTSEKNIANLDNDYLASVLEEQVAVDRCKCFVCNCVREAAARLRKVDSILAKLKVAEDALESACMYSDKLPHQWPLPERVRAKMENALAAIREEGGANVGH